MAVVKKAFGAEINLKFVADNKTDNLNTLKLSYLIVEYDYREKVLPTIILNYNASDYEYKRIIEHKDDGQFYLELGLRNLLAENSATHTIIKDYFTYLPSTTNPNMFESLNEDSEQDNYTAITLGLVSKKLTEDLRKSFNGIYADINTSTLIAIALEDTSCVVENIKYNKEYKSIIIPPISTRYKMLEFIQEVDPFFDTRFVYFMDFSRSYLVSKCGNKTDSGDGTLQDIIINIKDLKEMDGFSDGIREQNGAYIIDIAPNNYRLQTDQATDKIVDELVASDDDIDTTSISVKQGSSKVTTKKQFIRTEQLTLVKNDINQSQIFVTITKTNLDSSIFTPNKIVTINHYHADYKKYNGSYMIVQRKDFIKSSANDRNLFTISTDIILQPVTRIIPLNGVESGNPLSDSGYKKQTKSSDLKFTTKVTKRSDI